MAKLVLTHDGAVIREYPLDKERISVGRKPHNDIQMDDPTVSGEHAVFLVLQNVYVEDRNSTNGVLLNGKKVTRRQLNHGDVVRIGRHEFKFVDDKSQDFERTVVIPAAVAGNVVAAGGKPAVSSTASVTVINGPKSGEVIKLDKSYTKVGSSDQVAVIARRGGNFFIMPMPGVGNKSQPARLNDNPIGMESLPLKSGDMIEVGGTVLQFSLA
ncbi:MAG: FHA domain-containing protein [Gammaproteobacteria bacterium]|nr:FHA domain-containing protein [Gammaproteobacteria bacterium]MDH5650907.1 FHA domain-containing protein [Gammaproteobacteria bacterium]